MVLKEMWSILVHLEHLLYFGLSFDL
jgi:hypothetical protein